jgi:hypothetical protein
MVLRTARKDENVPRQSTSVTVGARTNADLLWRISEEGVQSTARSPALDALPVRHQPIAVPVTHYRPERD